MLTPNWTKKLEINSNSIGSVTSSLTSRLNPSSKLSPSNKSFKLSISVPSGSLRDVAPAGISSKLKSVSSSPLAFIITTSIAFRKSKVAPSVVKTSSPDWTDWWRWKGQWVWGCS